VTGAIRKDAQSTGANFDYLLTTAKVESNLVVGALQLTRVSALVNDSFAPLSRAPGLWP
jgi:hypothetical protein